MAAAGQAQRSVPNAAPHAWAVGLHTFLSVKLYLKCARFVLPHVFLSVCVTKHIELDVLEPDTMPRAAAEPRRRLRLVCDW